LQKNVYSEFENLCLFKYIGVEQSSLSPPLTDTQAEQLKKIYGLNVIVTGRKLAWYNVLIGALLHPFNILLTILAAASGATGDFDSMIIMIVMVFLSAFIRFYQEWKSMIAAKSLRKLISSQVCVIRLNDLNMRQTIEKEIPIQDIVPGDWIKLSAGDLIPADIQIKESKDLFVSQSSLTGEAIPVEKYASSHLTKNLQTQFSSESAKDNIKINMEKSDHIKRNYDNDINSIKTDKSKISYKKKLIRQIRNIIGLRINNIESNMNMCKVDLDCPDLCYMGTSIVSGTATAIVKTTGSNTYFGSMAAQLMKLRPQNAFQSGVRRISWLFFLTMACMVPPVLLLQGFLHHSWPEAFLFGLSVAVGLTPEMLPMIVNSTLARGALLMSKKKCIVKNLDSIINLGGMDVLCTDKTGTLTENRVALMRHVDYYGKTSALPLQLAFLNSYFQTSLKNLLDVAVIEYFEKASKILPDQNSSIESLQKLKIVNQSAEIPITSYFNKIDEIPFDFERRRMSVILSSQNENILISKGAVDEILSICSRIHLSKDNNSTSLPIMTKEITKIGTETDDYKVNDFEIPSPDNVFILNEEMKDRLR